MAGGIPVIKTLREALAGNQVRRVYGILNGTCNYILTQMQEEHRSFADVLAEAQAKGYAEADPTFDIGGFDTAHKLTLLTSLAFGTARRLDQVHVEGIETISEADIEAADDLGYRIKLLGVALMTESGIEQRVHPAMVPKHSAIAEVSGVTNCVAIDGDFCGNLLLAGAGAGARRPPPRWPATSSTSRAATTRRRSACRPRNSSPTSAPSSASIRAPTTCASSVFDRPGAMAGIAGRMGEREVSLESIVQRRPPGAQIGIAARPSPARRRP